MQNAARPSINLLSETTDKRRRVPRNPLLDSFKLTGAVVLAFSAATADAGDEVDADAAPAADNAGFALNAMVKMRVKKRERVWWRLGLLVA
jgi:hypothetical protein